MSQRKSQHEKLVDAAHAAIEEIFSDTSVTQGETRADLSDLKSDIQNKIACIDSDLRRGL